MRLTRDIQSLSVFKRDSAKIIRQLRKTGEPVVLTVNGKAAAVVHDPDSYELYVQDKERREMIAAVKRGIADMKAGRTKPADEVFREFERKHNIPSDL